MSKYVYVGDDEIARINGVDWCFENGRDTNNWIIPEHEGFTIDQDGHLMPMCGGESVNKTYMDGLAEGYEAAMKEIQRILDELADTYAMLEEQLEEINNQSDRSVEVTA